MPYYKSTFEFNSPALVQANEYNLQTSWFHEAVGFRSRPKAGAKTELLTGSAAEPYSWLDANNRLKQKAYLSSNPELAALFKKDKGHNWDLRTLETFGPTWSFRVDRNASHFVCENVRVLPTVPGGVSALASDSSAASALSSYAALEYGRTAPTSDQISMSAIVGELREGLPALIPALLATGSSKNFKYVLKRQTRRARDAGSDYLNVQFGWIPLLSDVRKIATALAVATSAISSDELSTHRRRMKPEVDTAISGRSTTVSVTPRFGSADFGDSTYVINSVNNVVCNNWASQLVKVDYSFEAEFIRLPETKKDFGPYLNKLNELMRWDITPMDLWQLAPWSWLVDWFFDIGAQLDAWNSATSNKILSLYAYGMRDERRTTTNIVSEIQGTPASGYIYTGPSSVYNRVEFRRRQRIKANPFGYILNPLSSLSAGQLAILGALGLTKARR